LKNKKKKYGISDTTNTFDINKKINIDDNNNFVSAVSDSMSGVVRNQKPKKIIKLKRLDELCIRLLVKKVEKIETQLSAKVIEISHSDFTVVLGSLPVPLIEKIADFIIAKEIKNHQKRQDASVHKEAHDLYFENLNPNFNIFLFLMFFYACGIYFDPLFKRVIKRFLKLHEIRKQILDSHVNKMFEQFGNKITSINLSSCRLLVDPEILAENLVKINLAKCEQLSDMAVDRLFKSCPLLRICDLSYCCSLMSPVVDGPNLVTLDMTGCSKLRWPTLKNCAKLQDVKIPSSCEIRRETTQKENNNSSSLSSGSLNKKTWNLYLIFELQKDCQIDNIKHRYKQLALIYHPDKNGNSKSSIEHFSKITAAFQWLGDEEKRKIYDTYGDDILLICQRTNNDVNAAVALLHEIETQKMQLLMKLFSFMKY